MDNTNYMVSIIIPAYNEARRLRSTILSISSYFNARHTAHEIIVVDDGSDDDTLQAIPAARELRATELHVLRHTKNAGKGFAVKRGMLAARGDLLLFTDADLSTPLDAYETLEQAIIQDGHDIAIGSRGLKESRKIVAQGFFRDRMGKLFGRIVKHFLLKTISDSQCGFKLFTKKSAQCVFSRQTIGGFGFDPEILYIAQQNNFTIKEVPVVWTNNFDSKLHPVSDSIIVGCELATIKIKALLGHYSM